MFKTLKMFLCILLGGTLSQCKAQGNVIVTKLNNLLHTTESVGYYNKAIQFSNSGNAYHLMDLRSYLGANNSIIENVRDDRLIHYQFRLIENIIKTAKPSNKIVDNKSPFLDGFKTWISTSKNEVHRQEVPLYEGYSFFYIAQFLYYTQSNGWSTASTLNNSKWRTVLTFIEENVWTKWYERSRSIRGNQYWYFLRSRTHMGSHWAGLAMYLNGLSSDTRIRSQTKALVSQYDLLLKRNLNARGDGFVWNATYDNVVGTDASKSSNYVVQDVSHGNHVVSYIVAAFQYGNENWDLSDINRLSHTFKKSIYNKSNNSFNDNVDGSVDLVRPGSGNFVGDGWVKLADYDNDVRYILENFEKGKKVKKYNQELQFKASLHKKKWEK